MSSTINAQSFNDPIEKFKWEEVLSKFKNLESTLKSSFESKNSCTPISKGLIKDDCSFLGFCKIISKNIDKPYLYQGKDGGKIPNYMLSSLEKNAKFCFMQVGQKFKAENQTEGTEENPFKEQQLKMQRAHLDLIKAVQETKSEVDYMKFQQIASEFALEDLEDSDEPMVFGNGPKSKEEIETEFDTISKEANIKLPAIVKEKFVESTLSMNMDFGTLGGDQFGQSEKSLNQNPFLDNALVTNIKSAGSKEKVLKNQKTIKDSFDNAENIFQKSKINIIKMLDQKISKQPAAKAQYTAMKKRIESIRFETPDVGGFMGQMSCPGPNAFYNPASHSFTLCPQILEFPEASLKAIIVHELGHSIDPCIMSQPLLKISNTKLNELMYMPNEPTEEEKEKERKRLLKLGQIPFRIEKEKYDDEYMVDFLGTAKRSLDNRYSNYDSKLSSAGIFFKNNPTLKVINCLASEGSVGARTSAKEETLENLNHAIEQAKLAGATESDPNYQTLLKTKENFNNIFDEIGACGFLPGNSQIQEAFSDWLAAEVLGQDIKEIKDEEKTRYSFESFGFFLAMGCKSGNPAVEKDVTNFMKDMGCIPTDNDSTLSQVQTLMNQANSSRDVHSHSIDRVQKIFISEPHIKKALGCKETAGGKHCE